MYFVWGGWKYYAPFFWMPRILRNSLGTATVKETLNTVSETNNIVVHSFNVMYNTNIKKLPEKMQKQTQMLIQEYKRSIIYKRYARCTNENLNNIIFDKNRICAHWIILCKKLIAYKAYQGKDKKVIEKIKEAFENMI